MSAEKLYYQTYTGEAALYDLSPEQAIDFAETYKEHERKRYEALVRLTNSEEFDALQKQVEKQRKLIEKHIHPRHWQEGR